MSISPSSDVTENVLLSEIQMQVLLMLSIQPRWLEHRQVAALTTEPDPLVIVQELVSPEAVHVGDDGRAIIARLSNRGLQVALQLWRELPDEDARDRLREFAPLNRHHAADRYVILEGRLPHAS